PRRGGPGGGGRRGRRQGTGRLGPAGDARESDGGRWPRGTEWPSGHAASGEPAGGDAMIRVVLAEDQTMVLSAFASLLDLEEDVEVVATATDGTQAVAAEREHRPDVLLTDIEMPEMSGLDLAKAVSAGGLYSAAHRLLTILYA